MSKQIEKRIVKAFSADVSIVDGERAVIARISTIDVDREGDVVLSRGCDSREFELNPIVFMGHDYYRLPVGQCTAIKKTDEEIIAKTVFASRPEQHPEGEEWVPDTLFSLFQQRVLRAFSVGFIPLETRPATDKDLVKYGAGARQIIAKWRMYEYSVAPLPCNQSAVALAVAKGLLSPAMAKGAFHVGPTEGPVKLKYVIDADRRSAARRHRLTV